MHRYHKILTQVKKTLGSIIFLENLLSLHNIKFVVNKVSSVNRSLACSPEEDLLFPPLFQQHSYTKSLLPALQWSAGNWQSHILTGIGLSPPFPSVLKPSETCRGLTSHQSPASRSPQGPRASGSCCRWCSARAAPGRCQGAGMRVLPAWPALDWPLVVTGNRSFVSEHRVLAYTFFKLILLLM